MLIFARTHIDGLELEKRTAQGAARAQGEEARKERDYLRGLQSYRAQKYEGMNAGDGQRFPRELAALAKKISDSEATLRRLERPLPELEARSQLCGTLHRNALDYLKENKIELGEVDAAEYDFPPVAIERVTIAIDEQRAAIASLKTRATEVRTAPVTESEALARVDAEIARLIADDCSVEQLSYPEGGARGLITTTIEPVARMLAGQAGREAIRISLFIALHAREIRELRAREIAALWRDIGPGLSAAQRKAELAQIEAALLEAEQREEHLLRQASSNGLRIDRRIDASPAALLGPLVEREPEPAPVEPAERPFTRTIGSFRESRL